MELLQSCTKPSIWHYSLCDRAVAINAAATMTKNTQRIAPSILTSRSLLAPSRILQSEVLSVWQRTDPSFRTASFSPESLKRIKTSNMVPHWRRADVSLADYLGHIPHTRATSSFWKNIWIHMTCPHSRLIVNKNFFSSTRDHWTQAMRGGVTLSLIGWAHTESDLWALFWRCQVQARDATAQDMSFHYTDDIMTTIASQITSPTVVYSIVYSGPDQRKHQSFASLAFVRGIHRDRWIPRTKGQ